MTRTTKTRIAFHQIRRTLSAALVAGLALGAASPTPAQIPEPALDFLTVVGDWEGPEKLQNAAAVEGLAVEIRSDLLAHETPRLRFQGFDGQMYTAELERLDRGGGDQGSVWIGRVLGYGEHSKVLLAQVGGFVSGYLDTPEARYEISPRPGGHVMIKLDPSRFAGCGTGGGEEKHDHSVPDDEFDRAARAVGLDPEEIRQEAAESAAESTVVIDILVAFTNTAANVLGGHLAAGSLARSSVASLDDAFVNSGVNARARLRAWWCIGADSVGDSGGSNDGVVLALYSNGSGISNSNDKEWHQARAEFGQTANNYDSYGDALAVGDFDRDGYDDLAIGIPGETVNGKSDAGAVRILYGSRSRLTATGTDFLHQDVPGVVEAGDQFGHTLATGDFDGDGYDDLAVGSPFEDTGDVDSGMVNILYGASGGITASGDQTFNLGTVARRSDRLGHALATGDFDADGYDDLAISVPWKDLGATDSGMLFVIYGSSGGLNMSRLVELWQKRRLTGGEEAEGFDRFGHSLAAGDFDNDGHDDLAVGVPHEDVAGKNNAGVIHAFYGSPWGFESPLKENQTFVQGDVGGGTEANDHFGWALAVGDINGDGWEDLVVGTPWEDSNDRGRVNVLRGTSSGLTSAGYYFTGAGSVDNLGYALAVADFNKDGYDDLAMGKPGTRVGANRAGSVSIYHGGTGTPTHAGTWHQDSASIAGEAEANDWFGSVLAAGDFDNDGDDDLAVGVPGEGVSNHSDYFETWMSSSPAFSAKRDSLAADLVGLIVQNLESGICGSAQGTLSNTSGQPGKYFQVSRRDCALGNFTFAHEIGHLIGLQHDPVTMGTSTSGACTTSGGAEYARGHFVSGSGRTIMSYSSPCSGGCPKELLFSNPDIDFSFGNPSGIANERDNARCANLTVGAVAGYRN